LLDQGDSNVILTRTETCVQLTYTLDEYKEFNRAIVAFRTEINGTLRNEIFGLQDTVKEHCETLHAEFISTLDYIDRSMLCSRTETGMRLTFSVDKFDKFNDNIALLSIDLFGFQAWHVHTGECEKADALENLHCLTDIFMRLLGNRMILDS
jgi:hypothetical protein